MAKYKHNLIVVAIIAIATILAISSVWNENIIVDEVPHIGAGYSYLVKQDMRLNPEHPPLAKDIAAIPLLFLNLDQRVFDTDIWQTKVNDQWYFGRMLIFQSGNDADLIAHAVKIPMLLFFVLSAVLVFKWANKLYGNRFALIALILFSFSPTIMAHSRFVTTDIPAMFGILLATYFFIKYLGDQTRKNLIIAGLTFGVALLLKFSTFLLVPYFLALAVIYGLSRTNKKLLNTFHLLLTTVLIFIVGFILVVWPVYYFHTVGYPAERQYSDTEHILSSYGNRKFADPVVWMSDKPVIRALGQYGLGLLMVVQRSVGGNNVYFLGEVSKNAWKEYFPIVYFVKEPLAWWALAIMAVAYIAWQVKRPTKKLLEATGEFIRTYFAELAMLLWVAVFWYSSVTSNLNIGVRHLSPTFPFVILLVSGQLGRLWHKFKESSPKKLKAYSLLLTALLGWYIFENLRIYPYYLTYFNQTVGGPSEGHKVVTDSNLDWGQDLRRFSEWVKENNIEKIEFDYFGWADPAYYLGNRYIWSNSTKFMDAKDFIQRNESNGWLAVSANFYQGSQGPKEEGFKTPNYLWLHEYRPVAIIGNSIFIFRITQ
ncbi:MAG: glycosyltransferase family 39 protein [bacterium]|nr:glycosyltransferase family 39 protein [bacterium]